MCTACKNCRLYIKCNITVSYSWNIRRQFNGYKINVSEYLSVLKLSHNCQLYRLLMFNLYVGTVYCTSTGMLSIKLKQRVCLSFVLPCKCFKSFLRKYKVILRCSEFDFTSKLFWGVNKAMATRLWPSGYGQQAMIIRLCPSDYAHQDIIIRLWPSGYDHQAMIIRLT